MFEITDGIIPKAQKIVVYGVEGIGKSTFASQFPGALFIDTEESTTSMNVKRLPKPTSWEILLQEVEFVKQTRPCQTLVIDTMDWAEILMKKYLIAKNNWTAIDAEGYGKKFVALADEMGKLLNKLSEVIEVGINVVITAHAMLRKKEEPDEMGAYDRYELKLEKKTAPLVKEWADMVLFVNYKTTIITDSKTDSKKATGGRRVMYTTHRPTWDAKNRSGLPDELPFEFNQIASALTYAQATAQPEILSPEPIEQVPNLQPERNFQPAPAIPRGLGDLMQTGQVTTEEIMAVIYQGGFMPQDTPIENVPADLWGYLETHWNDVMNLLNTQIRNF